MFNYNYLRISVKIVRNVDVHELEEQRNAGRYYCNNTTKNEK